MPKWVKGIFSAEKTLDKSVVAAVICLHHSWSSVAQTQEKHLPSYKVALVMRIPSPVFQQQ